jgi:hypothetical protein
MNATALAGWLIPAVAQRPIVAGPVVALGPDRLDVFVTGPDSALHHKSWNGDTWSDYESLGGVIG